MSLCKSTTEKLWPILCRFDWSRPFEVALFHGMSKPSPIQDFVEDFVWEYNELSTNGLRINNKTIRLNIDFLVCDAVARQHIKKVKSHSGYYACERCDIKGVRDNGYTIYETTELAIKHFK